MNVLVIGGGPAGVTAALRARELGAEVTLVERDHLGGTCTNDGCVPTRALARAARLIRDAEQYRAYGLEGEKPIVNLPALLTRTHEIVYKIHEKKQLLNHLHESGVKTVIGQGEARFIDAHTIQVGDGMLLKADRIILCVGGHARRLDFPGAELALTHDDVWHLKELPKSMAIIGGAATGCQLASIFAAFGANVTILEVSKRLVAAEDELISRAVRGAFARRGIQVITGMQSVERIEKTENGLALYYRRDDQPQFIEVEAVLQSVGWPGNVDTLNLAAAGVETVRTSYIKVDDTLQTSQSHIYAAGDITGRMMLVQSGGIEARAAAENAMLGPVQPNQHKIVPHGGFTDPEYASVGISEAQALERFGENGYLVSVVPYADMDRAVIDGHTEGFCKLIVSQDNHRILGAHVVGEQAVEIVHVVAAGMAADMWLEQLAELEIAYPTYTAVLGLAARNLVRELGVMPLSPQWRSLGRPHAAEWERSDFGLDL